MSGVSGIVLVRIDDRLLHGQVVTTWVRDLGIHTIWIVSNRVVAEPIEIILLQASVPATVHMDVMTIEEAIRRSSGGPLPSTLMLMFECVQDVLSLITGGFPIEVVNLGGLRYRAGKVRLSKAVYVGQEDVDALFALEKMGIDIGLQEIPSDRKSSACDRVRKKWGKPC